MAWGLGYRPDPPDERDHDALKIIRTTPPPSSVMRSPFTKTLNQGGLGSCTTNAVAQIVRANELSQLVNRDLAEWIAAGNEAATFDFPASLAKWQAALEFAARLFWYYLARATTHETGVDAGTYIRTIFQVANTFGFPAESLWTYDDNDDPKDGKFTKMPSSAAFRGAFDQKLFGATGGSKEVEYARISETGYARVDAVKRALADGHLVAFGTDVGGQFCSDMSGNGGKPVDPPSESDVENGGGGHAMCWGGYDDKGPDTKQSWGPEYGDDGWFKMSWDYVAWKKTGDLWIAKRAPLISGTKEAA